MDQVSVLKSVLDAGVSLLFLYLYVRADSRLWERETEHDRELREVNDKRVQDIKLMTRTPTNLEA